MNILAHPHDFAQYKVKLYQKFSKFVHLVSMKRTLNAVPAHPVSSHSLLPSPSSLILIRITHKLTQGAGMSPKC